MAIGIALLSQRAAIVRPWPVWRTVWLVLAALAFIGAASVPRLHDLATNPPEYFEDELSGVVSAWSVVTTGADVEHTALPFLATRMELKPPLFYVATIPFTAVLGPGVLAARLPAVAFGLATIALIAWTARCLGLERRAAVGAALVVAIAPWAIHYSRVGWQPAAWLPFCMAGIGLLWVGLEQHRPLRIVGGAGALALGWHVYHPAMLMHVLIAAVVVGLFLGRLVRRDVLAILAGAVVAAVVLLPFALVWDDPALHHRTSRMFVFRDGLTEASLGRFVAGYFAQWDPAAVFGDATTVPRINPGRLLPVWTVPLLVLGVATLIRRHRHADLLVLALMALGPLPAALAQDEVRMHAARGLVALPAIALVAGVGLSIAVTTLRSLIVSRPIRAVGATLAVMVVAAEAGLWATDYFGAYPARSAASWGYGSGAAMELAARTVPDGGALCIAPGDISPFTLPHRVRLHLGDLRIRVIEGTDASACRRAGAHLLGFIDRWPDDARRRLVASVPDIDGDALYGLWIVLPRQ